MAWTKKIPNKDENKGRKFHVFFPIPGHEGYMEIANILDMGYAGIEIWVGDRLYKDKDFLDEGALFWDIPIEIPDEPTPEDLRR